MTVIFIVIVAVIIVTVTVIVNVIVTMVHQNDMKFLNCEHLEDQDKDQDRRIIPGIISGMIWPFLLLVFGGLLLLWPLDGVRPPPMCENRIALYLLNQLHF